MLNLSTPEIIELGPRDGLQNEKQTVPTAIKVELIERLVDAGVRTIETTSFVSPKWVPQMADNTAVMQQIRRKPGVRYSVLVPNMKGYEAAIQTAPDEITVFGSASEAFSQKNINCSIAESIERFAPVVEAALAAGLRVRGAMSCTVGCPYEGDIPAEKVGYLAGLMHQIGVQQVAVADTIGVGSPIKVQRAIEATLQHYELDDINIHFHDTYGQALANTWAAVQMGVRRHEASVAGLGGCPYAKGASGNVATEDVVYMLHNLGLDTGIDLDKLVDAGAFICDYLQRPNGSRVASAMLRKRAQSCQP